MTYDHIMQGAAEDASLSTPGRSTKDPGPPTTARGEDGRWADPSATGVGRRGEAEERVSLGLRSARGASSSKRGQGWLDQGPQEDLVDYPAKIGETHGRFIRRDSGRCAGDEFSRRAKTRREARLDARETERRQRDTEAPRHESSGRTGAMLHLERIQAGSAPQPSAEGWAARLVGHDHSAAHGGGRKPSWTSPWGPRAKRAGP